MVWLAAGGLATLVLALALSPRIYRGVARRLGFKTHYRIDPGGPVTSGGWIKAVGNPVLGGELGTCFDAVVSKDDEKFRMWFSWRPQKSIGLVESNDGIHWSKPVIALGPDANSGWEAEVNRPGVVLRGGVYHMWYTGQQDQRSMIGHATSSDGVQWKRLASTPEMVPDQAWEKVAVMCPNVLWDEGGKQYRMWYSGGDQYEPDAIGYATSSDGSKWLKNPANPIFRADSTHGWEKHKVTACQVVPYDGEYLMFYIGFADEHNAQIGMARSRDGVGNWRRFPDNPIVRPGNDEADWDFDAVYKPSAVLDHGKWYLWFNGRNDAVEQIGLATHEGADLWPKESDLSK